MSEWKEYKLADIAQLVKNSWKVGDKKLPYIALEHIVESGLRLQGIGDSNTIASNKYHFNSDSFLFGKLRPYFRKLYRPDFEGICSTDIWVVKPKGKNNKNFLFYFFANQEFVDFTYSGSSGTRMPRADWNFVSQAEWMFPDPAEQKAIAEVLSSLDDKIDLLHRQNKTLEQMAETLFRQWFVVEAGEDWEEGVLGGLGEVVTGKTPSKKFPDYWGEEFNFITPTDFRNFGMFANRPQRNLSKLGWNKMKSLQLPERAILVTCIGSDMGKVTISSNPCVTNQQLNSIILKEDKYLGFVFEFIKSQYQLLRNIAFGGTTMPIINKSDFSNISIPIPPENIIDKFQEHWEGLSAKIFKNQTQIHSLEKMRDTLLPKLMSGEVRIASNG